VERRERVAAAELAVRPAVVERNGRAGVRGAQPDTEVDVRLELPAERIAVEGEAAIGARRRALDPRHALVVADGGDNQLLAREARIRIAERYALVGDANGHVRTARIIPVRGQADGRTVDGRPRSGDEVLHPEVEIGLVASARIPRAEREAAVVVGIVPADLLA